MICGRFQRNFILLAIAVSLGSAAGLRAQMAPPALAPATADAETAAPIVGVRIVTGDGHVVSESPSGVGISIGKPLDPDEVRESLRKLYRSGDYADIVAETAPVAGGLRLDFVVRENLFFSQVLFDGLLSPPSESTAAAAMQINFGETYRKEVVEEALGRLQETLRDNGFYTANVSAEGIPHPQTREMDILVRVQAGPRARVGDIHLTNQTEYLDPDLLERFGVKTGRPIDAVRLQRGSDKIRKFLVKKNHLSARAVVTRGPYDAAKNSVALNLEVSEGPLVEIAMTGTNISKGALKKLVPIYQEGAVDEDLLTEGQRNILERLERDGYFDAQVNYTTETSEKKNKGGASSQKEIITYHADRGERHRLVGIEVTGNHYFSSEFLRSRLLIYLAALGSRGRFSRRLVDGDAQSMKGIYQANGFLQAGVEAQIQDDYKGKQDDVFVRFVVQEGTQTRVVSLRVEGNHAFSEAELRNVIGSTPGQPYSESNVAADRDNILALYFNEGFPGAHFTSTAEKTSPAEAPAEIAPPGKKEDHSASPSTAGDAVRLTYHIEEGPQIRVRRLLLTGYRHTKAGVIRRQISVQEGQPLREGEVVESQQHLYNLGIFNRVTIEPQNPGGSDPQKNVVALVEEAKRYTVAYGGGFEVQRLASTTNPTGGQFQASPRGILEVSKENVTGRADTLSFKVRGSTLQGRALLGYSSPVVFGRKTLSFQATAFAEKTRDISTFDETHYEGSLQLTQTLSRWTTILYRYSFRKVLVSNLNIQPEEIPLFNQPTLVSSFGLTWFRDRRDNPADATRGSFTSADFSAASTAIGSSASFLRFFMQNSTYYPIKRRFAFARSARIGMLVPFHDTVSLSFPPPAQGQCTSTNPLPGPTPTIIPLPERFFTGGGTSLRSFALNQAGPRDPCTGFPVGGQAELVFNQEFRFPLRVPHFGTQLGGALFYDGGNVFSRVSRMTLRLAPPKPVFDPANPAQCQFNCTNELNYFSHTIGLGLRYSTPVGPIRIDLGYQLNRPVFVVPIPCPSSTPNCTPAGQQAGQLSRFQIFFNLGAPF